VEDPFERTLEKLPSPVEVRLPVLSEVAKRLVEEAVVEKMLVVVALPEMKTLPVTPKLAAGVVEPTPTNPFASIVRAVNVEVAKVEGLEVEI